MADLSPGQVIRLPDGRQATIRFVGSTHFAPGDWVGIELEDASGKNDGSVQGERYFDCEHGFGMFIRPSAVSAILEQPKRPEPKPAPRPAPNGTTTKPRPQSAVTSGVSTIGAKRTSVTAPKRQSVAATPSPATRTSISAPRSLRSPTKSPTKQLSSTSTSAQNSRTSSVSRGAPSTVKKPTLSNRTSMGPPSTLSLRPARQSVVGTTTKPTRPGIQGSSTAPSGTTRQPPSRLALGKKTSTGSSRDEETSPGSPSPDTKPSGPVRTSSQSALSPATPQRSVSINLAVKELEDLKTKLRIMEKKRSEDREKLKSLEQLQSERDKFEGIIQKLQAKYQPQQMEIGDLRKQLKSAEARLEEAERLQAEHESILEMAALDREMAEETAEAIKSEFDALKLRTEELQLEAEVLREENEELGQVMSPEEKSSQGWLQMERSNERLREALIRLRDMTQQQEADLRSQIKELEEDLEEYASVKSQFEATKEKLLQSDSNVEDLKQQLETALGAEEMIEELAEKNMQYQEEITELKAAIEDLESLKELNDELEINHIETEKQLQEEIDFRESVFLEQSKRVTQQDEVIEDLEYTLARFRELVSNLQGDLEDMRASQQLTETEANDLTVRSRAMMDLNTKLQASMAKAQTKTIDVELGRMDAEEASQHLSIVKLYLPQYFDTEKNPILALLRFKRISFKSSLMHSTLRERIADPTYAATVHDDTFTAYEVLEKLTWISSLCDRFVNFISGCSVEEFARFEGALYELEPVERILNFLIDGLKKNELDEKKCAVELQRSIALLTHLAETLIPINLESFADEIYMGAVLTQTYLESTAACISNLKTILQSKLPAPSEEDEEGPFLYSKFDTLSTHARSAKVAVGKVSRALEELKSRSLGLTGDDVAPSFQATEQISKSLSEFARQLGGSILQLTGEEGRTEPYTYTEVNGNMSQIAISVFQPSGSDSESSDALSLMANKLRELNGLIEEIGNLSTDLSRTGEFERYQSPWIARANELKSNQTISPDVHEEIRRLKNEIHEASTALGVKDKSLEEHAIKIELLESRMRDANKKAALVKDLEANLAEVTAKERELVEIVEKQSKDLQAMEGERDEYRTRLEKAKRASGSTGGTANGAGVLDNFASLATARENEALRAEVTSLQATVRFLREDNRRVHLLDPGSVHRTNEMRAWLDTPLVRPKVRPQEDPVQRMASECQDVLTHILDLSKESRTIDLKLSQQNEGSKRLAWRPVKSTPKYQALRHREDFEKWVDWKDDLGRRRKERERAAAAKTSPPATAVQTQHTASIEYTNPRYSLPASHGMMGRAWRILGMQSDDDSKEDVEKGADEVQIMT